MMVVTLYRDESTTYELQRSVQAALLPLVDEQQELMDSRGSGEHEVFWEWLQETFMPVVLPDEDSAGGEDSEEEESSASKGKRRRKSNVRPLPCVFLPLGLAAKKEL